jgi:hypothetical protein
MEGGEGGQLCQFVVSQKPLACKLRARPGAKAPGRPSWQDQPSACQGFLPKSPAPAAPPRFWGGPRTAPGRGARPIGVYW